MSYGVIGNTSGFGPEESRFEPLWDNNKLEDIRLDEELLLKSSNTERYLGFESIVFR
jgi:hypothetical protein